MNILFDHQIFCLQKYGGISRYFYELANHISGFREDHVEIFAPLHLNGYLSANGAAFHAGRTVPPMLGMGRHAAWTAATALAYLRVKPRPDVDILHETYFSTADYLPEGATRIVTVHDMVHEMLPRQFPHQERLCRMKARAVERADHVICVSENTRRDLIRILNVPEEKTSVVYHGCAGRQDPDPAPSAPERPYILFVGKRGGYKNFETLLRGYAHSLRLKRDLSLVCFGGGRFSPDEEAAMRRFGLSDGQVLQKEGGDRELMRSYAHAAVFVYPSAYEGFGIPLLEAMSSGCPIACSNAGPFPEVAGRAAEFFDPADEEDIRRAIEKIVYSTRFRKSLIQLGRERAGKFSWDQCARDTLQVYRRCLPGKHPSVPSSDAAIRLNRETGRGWPGATDQAGSMPFSPAVRRNP